MATQSMAMHPMAMQMGKPRAMQQARSCTQMQLSRWGKKGRVT